MSARSMSILFAMILGLNALAIFFRNNFQTSW